MTDYKWLNQNCHDCDAKVGELHDLGCDMETCPICGRQLVTCSFARAFKEFREQLEREPTPEEIKRFKEKGEDHFKVVSNVKVDRIPFIPRLVICGVCGGLFPGFFEVPNEEWNKYVIPVLQDKFLCRPCYDKMIGLFPDGWRKK